MAFHLIHRPTWTERSVTSTGMTCLLLTLLLLSSLLNLHVYCKGIVRPVYADVHRVYLSVVLTAYACDVKDTVNKYKKMWKELTLRYTNELKKNNCTILPRVIPRYIINPLSVAFYKVKSVKLFNYWACPKFKDSIQNNKNKLLLWCG